MIRNIISYFFTLSLLGQDCTTDRAKYITYTQFDVYNNSTHKYEGFRKLKSPLLLNVGIYPTDKLISFVDLDNKYDKTFVIDSCKMLDTILVYYCQDVDNSKRCFLIFGFDEENYNLTVMYEWKSVMYCVRRKKLLTIN